MSDIVERLRAWVYTDSQYATAREAANEIERLRLSARADCPEPENAANEDKVSMRQNMATLTSQERDVLREVCRVYADEDDVGCNEIAYVIDRILGRSRTGSNDANAGEDAAKCTVKGKELPERERVANHPANPDSSTLTAAEREAVAWAAAIEPEPSGRWTKAQEAAWNQRAATLRALLERL